MKQSIIQAIDYGFRHASRRKPAIEHLNLEIEAGERVLILGASGAGKSTLLAAITGVLGADQGEHFGSLEVRARVGMVLQDPDSQVIASHVGDDVAFGCENLKLEPAEIKQRVPHALQQVGLELPWSHPTAELSGGQKQRLALAGVLAMGADILCLDEPTANLDPAGIQEVVAAIDDIAAHRAPTILIVEHRVETWRNHIDRIIVLGSQGVLADGDPETIIKEQGEELAAAGVWIPGHDPKFPALESPHDPHIAIETQNLRIGWEQALPRAPINLSFYQAASTVLTGHNGAGKSTFLLSLAGLLAPQGGQLQMSSTIAKGLSPHPWRWEATELAARIGMVFQDPEMQFLCRTVREELLVNAHHAYGRPRGLWPRPMRNPAAFEQARALADEILERLGLSDLAEANPYTLSGGQKRRLSVASALVAAPEIVLLDEPTFGQDRNTFIALVEILRETLASGTTLIAVTHDHLYQAAMGQYVYQL